MIIAPSRISQAVFDAIKSLSYKVKLYDENGMSTVDPEAAVRMYVHKPNFLVYINSDDEQVEINRNGNADVNEYLPIVTTIQKFISGYPDYRFSIRDYGRDITPKDFSYQVKESTMQIDEAMCESTMYGSKKTSKQVIETVKLIIKHRSPVDESVIGARSRNISAIFLESNMERFRFPVNSLLGARAMARHMANGGVIGDVIGETIIDKTKKLVKLKEFHRYVKRNKLINESSEGVVSALVEGIGELRSDLESIFRKTTYESAILRLQHAESVIIEDESTVDYKDMFTVKKFDSVFEDMLPVISSICKEKNMKMKRIEESSVNSIRAIRNIGLSECSGLVFETKEAKFGSKLKDLAVSIVENAELSEFLSKTGDKLILEGKISDYEMKIVGNVLKNITFETKKIDAVDIISESTVKIKNTLEIFEHEFYNGLEEGIAKAIFEVSTDEEAIQSYLERLLRKSGQRLKRIEDAFDKSNGLEEKAEGFTKEQMDRPTKLMYAIAKQRYEAAVIGVGIANKLKNKVSKKEHQSKMMANLNLLRTQLNKLEQSLGIEKQVDDFGKRVKPAPNEFMRGTVFGPEHRNPENKKTYRPVKEGGLPDGWLWDPENSGQDDNYLTVDVIFERPIRALNNKLKKMKIFSGDGVIDMDSGDGVSEVFAEVVENMPPKVGEIILAELNSHFQSKSSEVVVYVGEAPVKIRFETSSYNGIDY